jgi:nucleotide-binding universal stress UspA family protein
MAKRILVPLSGQQPSETVLSLVGALARGGGAAVRLLRVCPSPRLLVGSDDRVVAYVDQEMARLTGEGLNHLKTVEAQLDGIPIESAVRFGDPVREIRLEAEVFEADLIVLRTTNRSRLRSALFPGVAEQVSRRTGLPTLVLRE